MSADPEGVRTQGGGGSRIGPDLGPRVAAAVVLGLAAIATAWFGGIVFVAFWWIASVIVLWEWQRIVGEERLAPRVAVGALVLAVAAVLTLRNHGLFALSALAAAGVAVGLVAAPRNRIWAAAGAVYAGALVVSLGLLNASPTYGLAAILWLFAIVWGADVGAYFAGRAIGGPKLWVSVSPGKTWSGAIAGAIAGSLLGLALSLVMVPGDAILKDEVFTLGLAVAVVSELGDLFESAVKRRFGVKDSSRLIPGHGGLMDRLDSFIAASAFAAAVAAVNTRGSFIASGLFQW